MQETQSSRILIEVGREQAGMTLFLQGYAVRVTWALMQSPVVVIITQMHKDFVVQCYIGVNTTISQNRKRVPLDFIYL